MTDTAADAGRPRAGDDQRDLAAARAGNHAAFERLVAPHRPALHAHCYRLLGSVHDAEDAVQDALVGAWRGLAGFEGRSSLRTWLYRIATNAATRVGRRRSPRVLAIDHAPPRTDVNDLGAPVTDAVFVEPWPGDVPDLAGEGDPAGRYDRRESVELAFVAALQTLPATQRAVVVLRDVLAIPATEVADTLDTTPTAVNSALQRARATLGARLGDTRQQTTLRALGDEGQRRLVDGLVRAWERRDLDALVGLLADDVRLTMPPLPAWFAGRDAVRTFFGERMFATPWRLVPTTANAQPALACYQGDAEGRFPLSGVVVLGVGAGGVTALDSFLDRAAVAPFALPPEVAP